MEKRTATPRLDTERPTQDSFSLERALPIIAIAAVLLIGAISIPRCSNGSPGDVSGDAVTSGDAERDLFISTWAERIDAFNEGYPLEGYGEVFAAAAYDYGVDPRYSPAIARLESESGLNCFLPCNAWGWGDASWSDWGTAIYAHVQGLSEEYSPTLTYEDAQKYNPANTDEWYGLVDGYMTQIWPENSL